MIAVHHDRAAILHHVLERIDKIRLFGETDTDPFGRVDIERRHTDKERYAAAGEDIGQIPETGPGSPWD